MGKPCRSGAKGQRDCHKPSCGRVFWLFFSQIVVGTSKTGPRERNEAHCDCVLTSALGTNEHAWAERQALASSSPPGIWWTSSNEF